MRFLKRPRLPSTLILHALFALTIIREVSAQGRAPSKACFSSNGTASVAQPCNQEAETSTCCAPGWICLTNGLCQATNATQTINSPHFTKAGCTDKDWKNPLCPQMCRESEKDINIVRGILLCDADKNLYCCQRDYDCCKNDTAIFPLPINVPIREITDPSRRQRDPGRWAAEKRKASITIGIAVGLGVLLILVVGAWIIWFFRRRSRKRKKIMPVPKPGVNELDASNTNGAAVNRLTEVAQVEAVELETGDSKVTRGELEGSTMSPETMTGTQRSDTLSSPDGAASTRVNIVTSDVIELDGEIPIKMMVDRDQLADVKEGGKSSVIASHAVSPLSPTKDGDDEQEEEFDPEQRSAVSRQRSNLSPVSPLEESGASRLIDSSFGRYQDQDVVKVPENDGPTLRKQHESG